MIVLFCIVISAISTVVATVFLQRLIDEVITRELHLDLMLSVISL